MKNDKQNEPEKSKTNGLLTNQSPSDTELEDHKDLSGGILQVSLLWCLVCCSHGVLINCISHAIWHALVELLFGPALFPREPLYARESPRDLSLFELVAHSSNQNLCIRPTRLGRNIGFKDISLASG
jgi:hypothetical protein